MVRVLQWVSPFGVVSSVLTITASNGFVGDGPGAADSRLVQQALEPALDEPLSPFPHGGVRGAMTTCHRRVRERADARKHQSGPKRQEAVHVGPLRQTPQLDALDISDH